MRNIAITIILFLSTLSLSFSQIGLGFTGGIDLYQYYQNPSYSDNTNPAVPAYSSGSALANFNLGPKIWVGGPKFSVSVEGQASFAPFALDVNDYKGLGAVAFPISMDINIGGLSGFNPLVNTGFSIGGGILFKKSELYFVEDAFSEARDGSFNQAYFGQVAYGIGAGGLVGRLYARYATAGKKNSYFSIGFNMDMNMIKNKFEVDTDELYAPK